MDILNMIIFWMVVITPAIWLLSRLFPRVTNNTPSQPTAQSGDFSESPLDVAQQRYSRGELFRGAQPPVGTEFEQMREDLEA